MKERNMIISWNGKEQTFKIKVKRYYLWDFVMHFISTHPHKEVDNILHYKKEGGKEIYVKLSWFLPSMKAVEFETVNDCNLFRSILAFGELLAGCEVK